MANEEYVEDVDTTEVDDVSTDEGEEESGEVTGVSSSSIEDRARQQGWKPAEEWDGDPNDWVGPEAFLVRGELFGKLKNQSKTINELNQVVNDLKEHHSKTAEREFERALNYLKNQKREALDDGDHDLVMELDDKIADTRKSWEEEKSKASEPTTNPEFESWLENPKNRWYLEKPVMRAAADRLAEEYAQKNPKATFEDAVKYVESQMEDDFPQFFKPKAKSKNPTVNEPSYSANSKGKGGNALVSKLTEEQLQVGKRFVRRKVFKSLSEYAKELDKNGDI